MNICIVLFFLSCSVHQGAEYFEDFSSLATAISCFKINKSTVFLNIEYNTIHLLECLAEIRKRNMLAEFGG